jgi:hypothetical protein
LALANDSEITRVQQNKTGGVKHGRCLQITAGELARNGENVSARIFSHHCHRSRQSLHANMEYILGILKLMVIKDTIMSYHRQRVELIVLIPEQQLAQK